MIYLYHTLTETGAFDVKLKNVWTACLAVLLMLGIVCVPISANTTASPSSVERGNAYEMLNPYEQALYGELRAAFAAIAKGERASAEVELGEAFIAELNALGVKTQWTNAELGVEDLDCDALLGSFLAHFQVKKLMDALMNDLPFELYWYDKTAGYSYTPIATSSSQEQNDVKLVIKGMRFAFKVSEDYQAADYSAAAPTVNTQKAQAVYTTVQANAASVVNAAKHYSDYKKLEHYRDEICELVEYATVDDNTPYGDPWQLVSVFDGDPATNVVCEGYAKAFQYLCDLTDFTEDVTCYLAKGLMAGGTGAGAHMWNVVVMEDGKSYLVDITNSDQGSIGAGGGLFLAGAAGSIANGYTFDISGQGVKFTYGQSGKPVSEMDSAILWGSGADSILALASGDYIPPQIAVSGLDALVYDGSPITAGERGTDIRYFYHENESGILFEHAFFADSNGQPGAVLQEAPTDAGTYILRIEASQNGIFLASREVCFEIKKAIPEYTPPTELALTYGGALTSLSLPDGFSWAEVMTPPDAVGTYSLYVNYVPDDTANYQTVENIEVSLRIEPKDISGAVVTVNQNILNADSEHIIESVVLDGKTLDTDAYIVAGGTVNQSLHTYSITIEGIGNYTGTVVVEGKIEVTDSVVDSVIGSVMDSIKNEVKPSVDVSTGGGSSGCFSGVEAASALPLLLLGVLLICRKKRI